MKELYILRHANKDTFNTYSYDYDVPLTKKGEEDAKTIGKKLKDNGILPDLIVSSPAIRARTTAEIVASEIGYDKGVMYNEAIYQAFLNELIESITYTYDTVNSLMVVGHNPALTALAISLTDFKEEIKMGNVVKIEFDCDSWTSIDRSNSRFVEYFKVD